MIDAIIHGCLLVCILVALFLGVRALVWSKKLHPAVKYLAWFMIYVSLSELQSLIMISNPSLLYPDIILFFVSFSLLPGPFFLMFVCSFLLEKTFRKHERILLFAPFWIFTIIYLFVKGDIVLNSLSYEIAKDQYFPILKIEEAVTLVYGIIIILVCFKRIKQFEEAHSHLKYNEVNARTSWLKKVLFLGITLLALWVLTLIFDLTSVYRWGNYAYLPSWFGYLFFVIYIGYSGFLQSSILKERKALNERYKDVELTPRFMEPIKKLDNTFRYFERVELLMTKEKVYLSRFFNLNALAEEIAISPNYLSKIINTHAKVNFSDYVNAYRVAFAKDMLETKEFENYKMLSIALEAGFNSKSSFYNAFSKLTGVTPGQYKVKFYEDKES
jgi:AraC-like DNA-binding protein